MLGFYNAHPHPRDNFCITYAIQMICVYILLWVCICTFGYIHMYTCVEVRGQPKVLFPRSHPFYFLRQSLTDFELAKEARLTMSPRGPLNAPLYTPVFRLQAHTSMHNFFLLSYILGFKLCLHAFKASTSPSSWSPVYKFLRETGFLFTGVREVTPLTTKAHILLFGFMIHRTIPYHKCCEI